MSIRDDLEKVLREAVEKALAKEQFPPVAIPIIVLERPREKEFGDYATNLAMMLSRKVGQPAREVARIVVENISKEPLIEKIEIAGAGFINFFLRRESLHQVLPEIQEKGDRYGETSLGHGNAVQIEFVSANPTGPLNVVSARAAAVGDSLVRLMKACGYSVSKEYYVNDRGRQIDLLGQSVEIRYRQLLGEKVELSPEGYQGKYIQDIAQEILHEKGDCYFSLPTAQRREIFKNYAVSKILESQKKDLQNFGLEFDVWFRESQLYEEGDIDSALHYLKEKGLVSQKEGASWFRSADFGDEKNRVLVRKSGTPTYFLSDIAYHRNKFQRGFQRVIDIWGPDHHGYIPRMKAAVKALGYDSSQFKILIVQQVNLLSSGKPVKMSKRAGEFIMMAELIQEVGKDAARFFFLLRSIESHLDFDIDLAKAQSQENPVYYVQYAHARICSILKYARAKGYEVFYSPTVDLGRLNQEEELILIKQMASLPEVVEKTAQDFLPHLIPYYLQALATQFHSFYTKHRVISEDQELSKARVLLCDCVRIVLRNGLNLIGISAPAKM